MAATPCIKKIITINENSVTGMASLAVTRVAVKHSITPVKVKAQYINGEEVGPKRPKYRIAVTDKALLAIQNRPGCRLDP